MLKGTMVCFSVLMFVTGALSQVASRPIAEKIEWTWTDRPETPAKNLPNVLLVGDSITRAYYAATAKRLVGIANVYLFATSCSSGDPRLDSQLRDYFRLMGLEFKVVHFNNGMHGWGYSENQYSRGLPQIIHRLRKEQHLATLIWATTTPVRNDNPKNLRIESRNLSAAKLMGREHIPTDDQHQLMLEHQDLHEDDVHYTDRGSSIQAEQVTSVIRTALQQ